MTPSQYSGLTDLLGTISLQLLAITVLLLLLIFIATLARRNR